jgi:hypothetical protein
MKASQPDLFQLPSQFPDAMAAGGREFPKAGADPAVAGIDGAQIIGHAAADEHFQRVQCGAVVRDDIHEPRGLAVMQL